MRGATSIELAGPFVQAADRQAANRSEKLRPPVREAEPSVEYRARRTLALASHRRRRSLELVCRRAPQARHRSGNGSARARDVGKRSRRRRTAPSGRARSRVAGGGNARRMDPRRLHGRARLRLRAVRAGAEGLGARIKAERQTMYWPPFAVSVEPVMKLASSEARKMTQRATSSGSPRRPSGTSGRMFFSRTSFGTALTMSVAM